MLNTILSGLVTLSPSRTKTRKTQITLKRLEFKHISLTLQLLRIIRNAIMR